MNCHGCKWLDEVKSQPEGSGYCCVVVEAKRSPIKYGGQTWNAVNYTKLVTGKHAGKQKKPKRSEKAVHRNRPTGADDGRAAATT